MRKTLTTVIVLIGCQSAPGIPDELTPSPSTPDAGAVVDAIDVGGVDEGWDEEEFVEPDVEIPQDAERESADRDGDGTEEVLASWYDGGTGFGGTTCVLDDPSRGKRWQADITSYFGSPVAAALEPSDLPNDALRDALMDCVTGPVKGPTAGLRWWMAAFEAQATDTSSGAISAQWNIESTWQKRASIEEPGTVLHVPAANVQPWMKKLFVGDVPEFGDTGLRLVFDGTYDKFREVGKSGRATLFTSPHSVVLKRGKGHRLLFISDGRWGGTDKRRHASIIAAGFVSGGAWALQTSGHTPHTVWLLTSKEQLAVSLGKLNWTGEVEWESLPETFAVKRTMSGFRFDAGGVSATLVLP